MNNVAEIDGTAAELLEPVALLEDEPLLPQAARTRAALPATAVSATLLVTEYKESTSLMGGTRQDPDAPRAGPGDGHRGPRTIWENTRLTRINACINIHVSM